MFLNKPMGGFGPGMSSYEKWKPKQRTEKSFVDFSSHYRLNEKSKPKFMKQFSKLVLCPVFMYQRSKMYIILDPKQMILWQMHAEQRKEKLSAKFALICARLRSYT